MGNQTFQDLVDILTDEDTPVVWSLLVSLFGDFAQGGKHSVSSQTLNAIMGKIGIRPEAIRVALHRLRKEGWLSSKRDGRTSLYSFTEKGRSETVQASPRIYQDVAPAADAWIVINRPGTETEGYSLVSNVLISPKASDDPDAFSQKVDPSERLPEWMLEKLHDPQLAQLGNDVSNRLKRLASALVKSDNLTEQEVTALRVLVVHIWRRLALRTPPLPRHFFPQDWPVWEAEKNAHDLLSKLQIESIMEPDTLKVG